MEASRPRVYVTKGTQVRCGGSWTLEQLGDLERRLADFAWPPTSPLLCDASEITAMDTAGAVLLRRALRAVESAGRRVSLSGLHPDFSELMKMASANLDQIDFGRIRARPGWLERMGRLTVDGLGQGVVALSFLGESTTLLGRQLAFPASLRWRALFRSLDLDGFRALPIVGLLTFLMGVVIAYQGAEQLRTFGANIFVVDLVGISLLREIAPLVTAILVAGRSGSAYAAQIGTMKVTEELDALRTLGISPIVFLVLPKVLALVVAVPLLTVFADIVGVFGGMLVAASQLGVSFTEFLTRFEDAVALRHFLIGIGKAPVFAIIIALVGCYQGFRISGGVDSVGEHTTISVVQSIFLVIVFDAVFSVVLSWWKI